MHSDKESRPESPALTTPATQQTQTLVAACIRAIKNQALSPKLAEGFFAVPTDVVTQNQTPRVRLEFQHVQEDMCVEARPILHVQ